MHPSVLDHPMCYLLVDISGLIIYQIRFYCESSELNRIAQKYRLHAVGLQTEYADFMF